MKLEDITLALEMTSDSSQAFYDLITNEITWLDDFGMTREEYEAAAATLDAHGFKRLPDLWDINEYGMMEDFAKECESRDLLIAINGRGAFRRFKDAVHSLRLEQEWYHFREAQYMRIALEWCRECGIELDCDPPKAPMQPSVAEFNEDLIIAQEWTASAGYRDDDVNSLIKSVRKRNRN